MASLQLVAFGGNKGEGLEEYGAGDLEGGCIVVYASQTITDSRNDSASPERNV